MILISIPKSQIKINSKSENPSWIHLGSPGLVHRDQKPTWLTEGRTLLDSMGYHGQRRNEIPSQCSGQTENIDIFMYPCHMEGFLV